MISPTGLNVRVSDTWGFGTYGSGRTKTVNGKKVDYRHNGADYVCRPGQEVVAPIDGTVVRIARPYAKKTFSGLVIVNANIEIKMFYLKPLKGIVGKQVKRGELIGYAQDIGEAHSSITPHIHLQVDSINPELLMGMP